MLSYCFTGVHSSYPEDVQSDASLFDLLHSCWTTFGCSVIINYFFLKFFLTSPNIFDHILHGLFSQVTVISVHIFIPDLAVVLCRSEVLRKQVINNYATLFYKLRWIVSVWSNEIILHITLFVLGMCDSGTFTGLLILAGMAFVLCKAFLNQKYSNHFMHS